MQKTDDKSFIGEEKVLFEKLNFLIINVFCFYQKLKENIKQKVKDEMINKR